MRKFWITGLAMMMGGCATGHGDFRGGPPPGMAGGLPGMMGQGPGGPGRLFISPMGEPFRTRQPQNVWFDRADTNQDGALTLDEFQADAARFFALLDRGHDGEIDPGDIEFYETVMAPEIRVGEGPAGGGPGGRRVNGRGPGGGPGLSSTGPGAFSFRSGGDAPERMGRQGAGGFSYLDYPQPVAVADRNFNRGVDAAEFARAADERFALLDKNGDGRIERGELPSLGPARVGSPGGRAMEE